MKILDKIEGLLNNSLEAIRSPWDYFFEDLKLGSDVWNYTED